MPYIHPVERRNYDLALQDFPIPIGPGHLNYVVTKLVLLYLTQTGHSYLSYNEVIGALECCQLEFYRRQVALYENDKILLHGDVYSNPL